jgi:hypothetical protein
MAFWPAVVYCCRMSKGREFDGKAAESLGNQTLRHRRGLV